jgi:peptidyl-tRNA hydrolase
MSKVVYIIVNKDLNMSLGKTCAQVGHAVQYLCQHYFSIRQSQEKNPTEKTEKLINDYLEWSVECQSTKIILGADSKEFNKLKESELDPFIVTDAGKTEVEPGTETVLAFWPMEKDSNKVIKRLRLLC